MFKKLKDKIAEEVKQSPSKITATVSQLAQAVVSPSSSSIVEPTSITDLNFSISEDAEDQISPAKRGFTSVDLREESSANSVNTMRSRHSSTSSLVSDNASFFPHFESHGSSFHLQSDLESASELDDSFSSHVTSTSKEQLVGLLRKSQQRYNKYKGRYADLAKHYRELERDNYKAKAILSESQDKALRRIAELKEQCQLEQRAKAHLEEILRNDLEEKDHLIMTLNTKIDLLKLNDSSDSPLEASLISTESTKLNSQNSRELQSVFPETLVDVSGHSIEKDVNLNGNGNEPADVLSEKVKKLEALLAKCKDAIQMHKEKVKEYSVENEQLKTDLAIIQETSTGQLKTLNINLESAQAEVLWLKKREEESALSLAETKRSIHSEMEIKEDQIKHLRQSIQDMNAQKDELSTKCNRLETQLMEIKQTQEIEKSSDNEKQIQELSRVKQEAMKILQAKYNETLSELKASFNDRSFKLESQIKELAEANELLQKNSLTFQVQLEDSIAGAFLLQEQIKQLEIENVSWKEKVTNAEALVSQNIAQNNNSSESKYTEHVETLEKELANLKKNHTRLQSQYDAIDKTLLDKQKKIDHCLSEKNKSDIENSKLSLVNQKLDTEVQELTTALGSANITVSRLKFQREELKKEQISVASAQQAEVTALTAELLELNEKITNMQKESGELKITLKRKEDGLSELHAQLHACQEQLVNSQTQSGGEVSTMKLEFERVIHDLRETNTLLSRKHEDVIREINGRHEQLVQSLQLKVESTEAELKKRVSELNNQKEEFVAQLESFNVINNALTLQLSEKQAEFMSQKEEFSMQISFLNANNEKLTSQFSEKQAEISSLKEEFEAQMSSLNTCQFSEKQAEISSLKEEFEAQINSLNANNEKLTSQLSEKQAKISSLKEEFEAQMNSLNANDEKLTSQFSEKQAEISSLKEEFEAQINSLSTNNEKITLQFSEKQAEISSLKEEFEAQINSLKANDDKLTSQLSEKQAEISSLKEEFQAQMNSLSLNNEEFTCILSKKQAEMEKKSLAFSQLEDVITKVTSEKDMLLTKLNENSEDLDRKSIELTELKNKLDTMAEFPEKLIIVSEQLNEANSKNSQLVEQIQKNSVLHEELQETLASVKSDLEKVIAEKTQLEKDVKMQASQENDLSEVVKQFQNEKQQSCSLFEELQVKLESQEQDIEQLSQRLNECTLALKERNAEFDENEEAQRQKIKILARNFDEKLHLKEEELTRMFDEERAKLESTEGLAVNQLRSHIKALKTEVRQAEETIANLYKLNKDLVKQKELEIIALEEKIKDVALANEFEIRECEQKWRSSLEKEISEQEIIHKEEVNALSREWSLERKTNNSSHLPAPAQELESTSQVAVAAVESGTGSIDLMHRQLLAITRELNDAKRRHKLETVELRRIIENRTKGGETTELEYLRNILFEYMMGREPIVLARVIAAVLKFDQDQTNKIIEKEEHKQSLLGHLGIL